MNDVVKTSSLRANPNPIDPDVKVPAAVRRAAEAAEAAQRAAYPELANQPEPTPPSANPDLVSIAPPSPVPPTPPQAAQPLAQEAPPVTPPGNEPPVAGSIEEWQQRFRSAEGRRLKAERDSAQMADRLAMIESEMMDLRNRPAPVAQTPQARLITPEEEDQFGTEMLDVMARRARESLTPELAEMRGLLDKLANQVQGTTTAVTRTARENMNISLDTQLPEWRKINKLDEFKAWLALPDPLFGVSRHGALNKAYEQNDTGRVLNFFKGFISELAASTPANELEPAPTPAPAPAKPDLASLAAPGRARTSAPPNVPAEKQIITTADIDAFYAAKRKGAYAGREAEVEALEQELFLAQREGRVVKV